MTTYPLTRMEGDKPQTCKRMNTRYINYEKLGKVNVTSEKSQFFTPYFWASSAAICEQSQKGAVL